LVTLASNISSQPLLCDNNMEQKSIYKELQYYNDNLLTDTLTATV